MKRAIDLTIATEPAPVEVKQEEAAEPAPKARPKRSRRPALSDTVPAIPTASFRRLVREISQDRNADLRWESDALRALQVDAEAYLIESFHRANKVRKLCKSKTLGAEHWRESAQRA